MVDVVTTNTILNGEKRLIINLLSLSDGTGEAGVIKINASTFTGPNKPGITTHFIIEKIQWDVSLFSHVDLYFDATANGPFAKLSMQGHKDYSDVGGLVDPQAAGSTGDILITTVGAVANASYDITISLRKKN